jgi:predicted ATPase
MTDKKKMIVRRDVVLDKLINFLNSVYKGDGIVVGLNGAPGAGKSTVLENFVAEIKETKKDEVVVLTGHCIDSEAMPYLPFVQALRGYFKLSGVDQIRSTEKITEALLGVSKDIVGLTPIVGPLLTMGISIAENVKNIIPATKMEVEAGQSELFYAVSQVLLAISKKKKILLAIEDAQWADRSTLHLLQHLASDLSESPVMILLSFRSFASGDVSSFETTWKRLLQRGLAHEVTVSDFSAKEFKEYLSLIFKDDPISDDIREILFTETGGNPFFISQIIPILLQEGLLIKDKGVWKQIITPENITLPTSVEAAIEERLQGLSPEVKAVLDVASVIGRRFEYSIFSSANNDVNDIDLEKRLESLTNRQLITELPQIIDVYEFIHAIMRDVIYRKMSSHRRRRVHQKIAEVLEQVYSNNKWDVLESLAYHYHQGGIFSNAIKYYLGAANKAISLLAYDEALRAYQRVLDVMNEDDPRFLDIVENAGTLADRTSNWPLALTYFERLLTLATLQKNKKKQGNAYEGISMVKFREGKWDEAETAAKHHYKIASDISDEEEKAIASFNLGQVYWRTGRWDDARKMLENALAIEDNINNHNRVLSIITVLGATYRNQGASARALVLYQRGITLFEKEEGLDTYWLGRIYNNQGTAFRSLAVEDDIQKPGNHLESAYWDQAVESYKMSLEIMRKIGSIRDVGNTCNNLAILYRDRKKQELTTSLSYCIEAENFLSKIDSPVDLLDTLRTQGSIYVQLGNFSDAKERLEKSLEVAKRLNAPDKLGLVYMELGTLFAAQSEIAGAKNYYLHARNIFNELGSSSRVEHLDRLINTLKDPL